MRSLGIVTALIIGCAAFEASSQETLQYRQDKAANFSNTYYLIRDSANSRQGKFMHEVHTDDGGLRKGKGTFMETRRKIFLTYNTPQDNPRFQIFSSTSGSDTLYIRCFDVWGEPQVNFNIRLTDTSRNMTYYFSDHIIEGIVKIPKHQIKNLSLSFYWYVEKIMDFDITSDASEVIIFANRPNIRMFEQKKETLRKTKSGFKAKGMWSKRKIANFVRE